MRGEGFERLSCNNTELSARIVIFKRNYWQSHTVAKYSYPDCRLGLDKCEVDIRTWRVMQYHTVVEWAHKHV